MNVSKILTLFLATALAVACSKDKDSDSGSGDSGNDSKTTSASTQGAGFPAFGKGFGKGGANPWVQDPTLWLNPKLNMPAVDFLGGSMTHGTGSYFSLQDRFAVHMLENPELMQQIGNILRGRRAAVLTDFFYPDQFPHWHLLPRFTFTPFPQIVSREVMVRDRMAEMLATYGVIFYAPMPSPQSLYTDSELTTEEWDSRIDLPDMQGFRNLMVTGEEWGYRENVMGPIRDEINDILGKISAENPGRLIRLSMDSMVHRAIREGGIYSEAGDFVSVENLFSTEFNHLNNIGQAYLLNRGVFPAMSRWFQEQGMDRPIPMVSDNPDDYNVHWEQVARSRLYSGPFEFSQRADGNYRLRLVNTQAFLDNGVFLPGSGELSNPYWNAAKNTSEGLRLSWILRSHMDYLRYMQMEFPVYIRNGFVSMDLRKPLGQGTLVPLQYHPANPNIMAGYARDFWYMTDRMAPFQVDMKVNYRFTLTPVPGTLYRFVLTWEVMPLFGVQSNRQIRTWQINPNVIREFEMNPQRYSRVLYRGYVDLIDG